MFLLEETEWESGLISHEKEGKGWLFSILVKHVNFQSKNCGNILSFFRIHILLYKIVLVLLLDGAGTKCIQNIIHFLS